MKSQDQLKLSLVNRFTFKDRIRILFGKQLLNVVHCEVTAETVGEGEETHIKLSFETKEIKTGLGRMAPPPKMESATHV